VSESLTNEEAINEMSELCNSWIGACMEDKDYSPHARGISALLAAEVIKVSLLVDIRRYLRSINALTGL